MNPDAIPTGGPAFPVWELNRNDHPEMTSFGMTMRDYIAIKAMSGFLANAWQAQELDSLGESAAQQMTTVAEISYEMADAMLKARGQ